MCVQPCCTHPTRLLPMQNQQLMEQKAESIAQHYIASGKAATRSKYSSNIPPEFGLLNGCPFKVMDLENQVVCQGTIQEGDGKKSRLFQCTMRGDDEEFSVSQAMLCSKLGLKPNYTLTQNIILDNFQLSISQLSARVGEMLPAVNVQEKH